MTPEEQVDLIRFMAREWKKTYHELLVFQAALNYLRIENPQIGPVLDEILEATRKTPTLKKNQDDQFSKIEEILNSLGEGVEEKAVRELLEKWPQAGHEN